MPHDKEFVLSHYPDATAAYGEDSGWTIDSESLHKALNWSDRTEGLAWMSAANHIKDGTDPIFTAPRA